MPDVVEDGSDDADHGTHDCEAGTDEIEVVTHITISDSGLSSSGGTTPARRSRYRLGDTSIDGRCCAPWPAEESSFLFQRLDITATPYDKASQPHRNIQSPSVPLSIQRI